MLRAPAAARLAARRAQLADLDASVTIACEQAAGQGWRVAPEVAGDHEEVLDRIRFSNGLLPTSRRPVPPALLILQRRGDKIVSFLVALARAGTIEILATTASAPSGTGS